MQAWKGSADVGVAGFPGLPGLAVSRSRGSLVAGLPGCRMNRQAAAHQPGDRHHAGLRVPLPLGRWALGSGGWVLDREGRDLLLEIGISVS